MDNILLQGIHQETCDVVGLKQPCILYPVRISRMAMSIMDKTIWPPQIERAAQDSDINFSCHYPHLQTELSFVVDTHILILLLSLEL